MLFGKEIIHLSNVESTNNFAAKLFSDKLCQNGSVIMSDYQTNGKGQRGSIWQSEKDKNLLCTFVYQPDNLSVENQAQINWATSLSVRGTLRKFGVESKIKWPNDLLVNGLKICGILIENQISGALISSSFIGIGLNINQLLFIDFFATSIQVETGKLYTIREILDALILEMNHYFFLLKSDNFALKKEYLSALFLLNKKSFFEAENEVFEGTIIDVSSAGLLVIEKNGKCLEFGLKTIKYC
jgi:BirA family transcriptional regulator, biotin operon repressor / biotin---[acetyl-CoA-carboxylase] ligase